MAEPAPSRRPGRLRRWVVRPLFWLLALAAVVGWLGSRLLDSDFLHERERQLVVVRLREALGRQVEVGRVELRLMPLGVEITDLRIPGPQPQDPPLAVVPRLRIDGELPGLRGGVLRLREVTLERPQIFLDVRPDGSTNLPVLAGGSGGGGRFEVRLDALRVENGEMRLAEQQVPLDFAARAVRLNLVGARGGELGGEVVAQEIELRLPRANPYPFSLSGRVRLSARGIQIDSARVVGPDVSATAHGTVAWKPKPEGKIDLVGEVSSAAFVRLGYLRDEVRADPHFEGAVRWGAGTWSAEGRFAAAEAVFVGRKVEALEGKITAGPGSIRVEAERARAYGGKATGSFEVTLGKPGPSARLKVHVDDADVVPLLAEEHVPIAFVAGRASGDFEYGFRFDDAAHGSGRLDASLAAAPPVGRQVALEGPVGLTIDKGMLRLAGIRLRSPSEAVEVEGALDLQPVSGAFTVHIESTDLGELAVVLPPGVATPPPLWFPTHGAGTADVSLALERSALTTTIRFDATDVEAPGARAARARGELVLLPDAVEGLRLELERPGGDLRVAGRIPLGEAPIGAAAGAAAGLGLTITAESWPFEEARPWLPKVVADLPVRGGFSGTVSLSGSLRDPTGEVVGQLAPASFGGSSLGTLRGKFHFDPAGLAVEQASLETASGTVSAHGRLRYADRALDVDLVGQGLALDRPPLADLVGGNLAGTLALTAKLGGTLDRPTVQARATSSGVVLAGQPPLPEATLHADWDGERLTASGSLLGLVDVDGGGPLTSEHADLHLDVKSTALRRLVELAVGVPQPDLAGRFAGTLAISGEPRRVDGLVGELRLSEVEASYGPHRFALREPALARLQGGRVSIESLYLAEPGSASELFLAGSLGFGAAAPLDLKVQAAIDSNWVDLLGPALRADGQLQVLGSVRGTLAQPRLNGQALVEGARVILLGFPHALENLDATLFFYPNQIVLDSLSGRLGGGTVTASGSLPLDGEERGSYRFQAALRDVTLRYPEGWLLRGSGELVLASTADGRQVRGALTLDRAYYLQDIKIGVAQLIQKILQKQRLEVADTSPILADTQLSIGIRAPGTLRVRNNVANLRGTADLTVRGTLAVPVVFGRVDMDAGGRVTYGDNDYTLDRAVVLFTNPYRFEPALDVLARTKVNDYRVTVNLNGKLERLNVNFASDPPVSDLDVFSLLATGQPTTTATTPGLTAQRPGTPTESYGALGFLYGQAASLIGQRVTSLFGIDTFRVDPLTTTGDSINSVRLTVGKRLRRDLYITYTVDPASTKEQYVKVEWQVRPELALVLTQNSDGTYAVDARWEKRF